MKKIKHPQKDLFVIDALDAIIKGDMDSMEHPFYSITKQPVKELQPYSHNGVTIEYKPSEKGFPTIYDKDLVIYIISNVIAMLEDGEDPPHEVEFNPYEFLVFTDRSTGGRSYDALKDCITRLNGSTFKTTAKVNGEIIDEWRNLIGEAKLVTDEKTKKPKLVRVQLGSVVRESIKTRNVLTFNREYFRLDKPIERRLYELARKHCGATQDHWSPYLKTLHKKSGSRSSLREFRRNFKEILSRNEIPDYEMRYVEEKDQVVFEPRPGFKRTYNPEPEAPPLLQSWVYDKAREHVPGYDIYALEEEWQTFWQNTGCKPLEKPEAAFIGWCKSNYGNPGANRA